MWLLLVNVLAIVSVKAWVYPEHRRICMLAIQQLDAPNKLLLDKFWDEIRNGNENRLTNGVVNETQTTTITQLDFAAWPAIAGDHSCSPQEMLQTVLYSDWILKVASIAATLENDLATVSSNSKHVNSLRKSDMQLMRADNAYVSRAGANSVHFLLPRKSVLVSSTDYLMASIAEGAPLNAIGAYAYFHNKALLKAKQYARQSTSVNERKALLTAVLADEAFAIHFLEDAFAAGHAAGSWGNASQQKGTHDYYNEHGLEVQTWDGKRHIVFGDAYLKKEDALVTAKAVSKSLVQIIQAAANSVEALPLNTVTSVDTFNICSSITMPPSEYDTVLTKEVFMATVIPGLENGAGALPRFRAEIGSFFGVSTSLNASSVSGGFGTNQTTIGAIGGIEGNIRFGVGLDGVLNQAGDGLAFIQFGWRQDAASSNNIVNANPSTLASNALASAIPARSAYNIRVRLPFYVIPGDLLLATPVLLLASPKTLSKMGVAAVNGGLLPWQAGIATRIGRFQMVLGREVGISLYGLRSPRDFVLIPNASNTTTQAVEYQSTKLEFPVIEYRSTRSFSQNQSSSLMLQLSAGVDMPHRAKTILPIGDTTPTLKSVWFTSIRIIFNWRHYL